jgi:hypothetical protein
METGTTAIQADVVEKYGLDVFGSGCVLGYCPVIAFSIFPDRIPL